VLAQIFGGRHQYLATALGEDVERNLC